MKTKLLNKSKTRNSELAPMVHEAELAFLEGDGDWVAAGDTLHEVLIVCSRERVGIGYSGCVSGRMAEALRRLLRDHDKMRAKFGGKSK